MFLKPVRILKKQESYAIDSIQPSLIKECADELAFSLLINQTREEDNMFPDKLK